ncbi:MAG: hypothetical protein JWM56_755 [Candidatus Peribacteria bacterium]|nr:hypothetical protein [Candidatus Peribacteria bacterium]
MDVDKLSETGYHTDNFLFAPMHKLPITELNKIIEDLVSQITRSKESENQAMEQLKACQEKTAIFEHQYGVAIEFRAMQYPETANLNPNLSKQIPVAIMDSKRPVSFSLKEYQSHFEPYLTLRGSSHFKEIHKYFNSTLKQKISVDQVYRALKRLAEDKTSTIGFDIDNKKPPYTRGGYFKIKKPAHE